MQRERNIRASRWLWGLAALLVALALIAPMGAQGASRPLEATLSGTAEIPSLDTTASGTFTGTFSGGQLTFRLTSDAAGITQAHIHLGAADENGGVVAFLFGAVDPAVDGIDVSGTITADDLIGAVEGDFQAFATALLDGNGYVNVHTEGTPSGEVRGQIAVGEAIGGPGLPSTGSGGLADTNGGLSPAGAGGIAVAVLLVALSGVRLALVRRRV